jgi:hypothetical protein
MQEASAEVGLSMTGLALAALGAARTAAPGNVSRIVFQGCKPLASGSTENSTGQTTLIEGPAAPWLRALDNWTCWTQVLLCEQSPSSFP